MNHFQKQSVLAIALCFLSTSFMLQSKVQPIHPGENLWQILKRIGCTEDIIEGKLDIFMELLCACPNASCPKAISQADIDPDGFTITAPGVYCLTENVTVPVGKTGIRIESSCVTLDLRGHVIDGFDATGGRETRGIFVSGASIGNTTPANVTIKNGFIKNHEFPGIRIDSVLGPVKLDSLLTTSCGEEGINIDKSQGVIVQDCISSENGADGFKVHDGSKYCVLKNCIARNNYESGFSLDSDGFCCLINCKAFENESQNGNFLIKLGSEHNVLFDCVASAATSGAGFEIAGPHNILLHCLANKNLDGFLVSGNKNVVRDCVAHSNDSDGFELTGGDNQVTGCDAINNGANGFNNSGIDNRILNNISHDNTIGQYSGVDLGTVELAVIEATGYWANIAP